MAASGVFGPHGADQTGPVPAPIAVSLDGVTFGDVLRAMNPLQYVPVVGTIYRLVTGDAAPSGLRAAVSAVTSVLTGGPVGLFGSIIGSLAEQFFHVEGGLRDALAHHAPVAAPAAAAPPAVATHAQAEADLGKMPATNTAFAAATAYRAAGLLGPI